MITAWSFVQQTVIDDSVDQLLCESERPSRETFAVLRITNIWFIFVFYCCIILDLFCIERQNVSCFFIM